MRKAQAGTLEEANRYLEEEFLALWNERFAVKAGSPVDAHRPLGQALQLASILSHVEQRQLTNDYTVAWQGRLRQIPREAVRPGLRRSRVRIEARLDGTLQARIGDEFVELTVCEKAAKAMRPERPARRYVNPPGRSGWMKGFTVQSSAALSDGAIREMEQKVACGSRELNSPFPFPEGKPGREGSPHAAQTAAPPTRGLAPPCASPVLP